MDPDLTPATQPIHLQIADSIRIDIERGDLTPADPIPTLRQLADQWSSSITSARAAVALLKQQGLISGGRGSAPVVRQPPTRVTRSSERHQVEKSLAAKSEAERRKLGVAETDLGLPLDQLHFDATYTTIEADDELAEAFNVDHGNAILQRVYEMTSRNTSRRQLWSVSYIPVALIESNPELLDAKNEPWPGGTLHQLRTVGIEVMRVVDEVTAEMPTTATAQRWGLDPGIPMLQVRRLSYDTNDRLVELSDADYRADRTLLQFTTRLKKWR